MSVFVNGGSGSEPFRLEARLARDTVRLVPVGEVDPRGGRRVDERVRELRQAGFERLVLDLRQVTFVGSGEVPLVIAGPPAVEPVLALGGVLDRLPLQR